MTTSDALTKIKFTLNELINIFSQYEHLFPPNFFNNCSLDELEYYIKSGVNVNFQCKSGDTPLLFAQNFEQTKLLLDAGASKTINVTNHFDHSPLMNAKDAKQTKILLENGAIKSLNYQCIKGFTAVHYANSVEQLNILLEKDPDLTIKNKQGLTAKEFFKKNQEFDKLEAIENYEKKRIEKLSKQLSGASYYHLKEYINQGANVNYQDDLGNTPLHFTRSIEEIKILIEEGADLNLQNKFGNTPLFCIEDLNQIEIEYLINSGANINHQNNFGNTVLHKCYSIPTIKKLLELGIDITIKNKDGLTAKELSKREHQNQKTNIIQDFEDKLSQQLFYTIQTNNIEELKELIEKGANVNIKNEYNYTPLHYSRSSEITKLLLGTGANPNSQTMNGDTPLHYAETKEITKLLLESGANPNIQNKYGYTPLHFVRTEEITKLLLEAGANPNSQTNNGDTPLFCAKTEEIIKLLVESGANINHQNSVGNTPLHAADTKEKIKLLLELGADSNIKNYSRYTVKTYSLIFKEYEKEELKNKIKEILIEMKK